MSPHVPFLLLIVGLSVTSTPGAQESAATVPGSPMGSAPSGAPPAPSIAEDAVSGATYFEFAGLGLTQSRTDGAYHLEVELRGLPPEQVQIRPVDNGLLIGVRRTSETSREEFRPDGQGVQRSWRFSRGQQSTRLPAPPDADLRAMQRVDGADRIDISIPRRADTMGYGRPPAGRSSPRFPSPPPAATTQPEHAQ
jgi:hypothetical protein